MIILIIRLRHQWVFIFIFSVGEIRSQITYLRTKRFTKPKSLKYFIDQTHSKPYKILEISSKTILIYILKTQTRPLILAYVRLNKSDQIIFT